LLADGKTAEPKTHPGHLQRIAGNADRITWGGFTSGGAIGPRNPIPSWHCEPERDKTEGWLNIHVAGKGGAVLANVASERGAHGSGAEVSTRRTQIKKRSRLPQEIKGYQVLGPERRVGTSEEGKGETKIRTTTEVVRDMFKEKKRGEKNHNKNSLEGRAMGADLATPVGQTGVRDLGF